MYIYICMYIYIYIYRVNPIMSRRLPLKVPYAPMWFDFELYFIGFTRTFNRSPFVAGSSISTGRRSRFRVQPVGLYKIFVYVEAVMHKSLILVLPFPTGIAHNSAIILHVYCATYDPPRPAPCVCHTPYNIGNAISCKGQAEISGLTLVLRDLGLVFEWQTRLRLG